MVRTSFKDFDIIITSEIIYVKKNQKVFKLSGYSLEFIDENIYAITQSALSYWFVRSNSSTSNLKLSITVKNNRYEGFINDNRIYYYFTDELLNFSKHEDILKSYGSAKLSKAKYKLYNFEKNVDNRKKRIELVWNSFEPTLKNLKKYLSKDDYEYLISNEYDINRNQLITNNIINMNVKKMEEPNHIYNNITSVNISEEPDEEDEAYDNLEKIIETIFKDVYPNEDIDDYDEIFEIDELDAPLDTIKNIDGFKETIKQYLHELKKEKDEKRNRLSKESSKLDSDTQYYYSSLQEVYNDFPEFIDKLKDLYYDHSKDLLIQKRINDFEDIYKNVLEIINSNSNL